MPDFEKLSPTEVAALRRHEAFDLVRRRLAIRALRARATLRLAAVHARILDARRPDDARALGQLTTRAAGAYERLAGSTAARRFAWRVQRAALRRARLTGDRA